MRAPRNLLLLPALLYSITYTQGAANMVVDCCLQTSPKRIPSNVVTRYEVQTPEKGCRVKAVVFFTTHTPSLKLCAPLGNPWVVKLMKRLDNKKKDLVKKERTDRKQKKPPQHQQRE
ncbi:C-C motif chemokine 19-like [Rana temporaria]|uniref:C-C motif chemokine 19-like n=1 Tax=Rana temporaria TaxID=8407 RepID=UPI001AAD7881|nr:C-C motif chemokine 19-like [Rana temporaria]XP_040191557.1 C-C motif chemokine 19-like [Rana temporaria]